TVRRVELTFRDLVLKVISDPTIAYILLLLGLAGLYFELSNPGAILPGVLGGICLLLALWAFQTLPINIAGLLLILLALILFIAEVKVASHGLLTAGGIASLILGSLMLIRAPEPFMQISRGVIIGTSLATAAFFVFIAGAGLRAQKRRPVTGLEGLIGEIGTARTKLDPEGQVFVRGELWNARCEEGAEKGEKVRVASVEGLKLRVTKISEQALPRTSSPRSS
ncbi:MAG: NfeD family protein, partial [Candidatus Methylomirabilales bacterium]